MSGFAIGGTQERSPEPARTRGRLGPSDTARCGRHVGFRLGTANGRSITLQRNPDHDTRALTLAQRYVGASAAALAAGVTVGLVFGYDGGQFAGLGLVAGMFALGIAVVVMFTFGVGASVLIDRLLGAHPQASIVVHAFVGMGAGALLGAALLDGGAARLGALTGLVAATVGITVSRGTCRQRAAWPLIVLASVLGGFGLAWWLFALFYG